MSEILTSRLSGFHKLSMVERHEKLSQMLGLDEMDLAQLQGLSALQPGLANQMIENAVGTFSLPLGLGLNLQVNGRDYLVPMAVEEPSVVAAVSFAAKIVREAGGFTAEADDPIMIGQVQLTGYGDPTEATKKILASKEAAPRAGQQLPPVDGEARRGLQGHRGARAAGPRGSARRAAAGGPPHHRHAGGDGGQPHQHHGRGRGARCWSSSPAARCSCASSPTWRTGGWRAPRAGFPWRCWRTSTCRARPSPRASYQASRFALADPYRAATHNKGIMNGIDAVAIATGQDWRAIEAGAHAFACRDGQYRPLSTWHAGGRTPGGPHRAAAGAGHGGWPHQGAPGRAGGAEAAARASRRASCRW